jgi:hypothetical protein
MDNSTAPTSSIEALTDALVRWAGMGEQMIGHMRRFAGDDPIPPIEVALGEVIGGTIGPLADRHAAADLDTAVTVLNAVIDTIAAEILLVNPDR